MKRKDTILSPMTLPHPMPDIREGDRRDLRDTNDQELAVTRDRAKSDSREIFQENLNGVNNVGNVHTHTKDVISSPMQGQRRASDGVYESPRRRDTV